jgi:hypothetical protein
MTKNDKLEQIASDLQFLMDLTASMKDKDIFPVSFFSDSFDLVQKIQNDFHTIEVDQVELFSSQMKKHKAMILSIHKQMRQIDANDADAIEENDNIPKTIFNTPKNLNSVENEPSIEIEKDENNDVDDIVVEEEDNSVEEKIYEEDNNDDSEEEESIKQHGENDRKIIVKSERQNHKTEKKSSFFNLFKKKDLIENGGNIIDTVDSENTEEEQNEVIVEQFEKNENIVEVVDSSENEMDSEPHVSYKPVDEPATVPSRDNIHTLGDDSKAGIDGETPEEVPTESKSTVSIPVAPKKVSIVNDTRYAGKSENTNEKYSSKDSNLSLNDVLSKDKFFDLQKAFSINDRFRYRRELFGGKEDLMNKVIKVLNNIDNYDDSLKLLTEKLKWDLSNPSVKDFLKTLELKYKH